MEGAPMTAIAMAGPESDCACCGGDDFREWDAFGGGGWSPTMPPLSFFEGGRFRLRACLACGHVDWFVAADSLDLLRGSA